MLCRDRSRGPAGGLLALVVCLVPLAAAALGANVIEKHYTVDKTLPGSPDHHLSVDPPELKALIDGIRTIERALGKDRKGLEPMEEEAFRFARRSVTSELSIPKGTTITREMLTYKRPGTGISPRHFDLVIGGRFPQLTTQVLIDALALAREPSLPGLRIVFVAPVPPSPELVERVHSYDAELLHRSLAPFLRR